MVETQMASEIDKVNPYDSIDQEDSWKVIDSYFKQNGLVAQQIFSYERFLQYNVQETIKEYRVTEIERQRTYLG